jgi:hypothetical protein
VSFFNYLFGRHRVSPSQIQTKVASKVRSKIDDAVVYNPINDWRLAALRQYLIYPVIKLIFRPILVASRGRRHLYRIAVAIKTLRDNSVRPIRTTFAGARRALAEKKNPRPLLRWVLSLALGDATFRLVARGAAGAEGVSVMKSVALSSLIFEGRRLRVLAWAARLFWLASFGMLYPAYAVVADAGVYRTYRSVLSSYRLAGLDGVVGTDLGHNLAVMAALWVAALVSSILFSNAPAFTATKKIEEFFVWSMKLTEEEIEKLDMVATPFALVVLLASERVTLQRVSSLRGNWPNKFSPGPGVLNPTVEGLFVVAARPTAEAPEFINADLSVAQTRRLYGGRIVKEMSERREKTGEEVIFCGEVLDPSIWEFRKNYIELKNNPHLVAIGITRSGKTKSLLSLIYTFASAYPDTKWYFADGKRGADFDSAAMYLSEYPVAKIRDSNDGGLVEFANLMHVVHEEFKRRQKLYADAPVACSSIYEYRSRVGPLPQIVLVVDEFFKFVEELDFKNNMNSSDTLAQMLRSFLAQGASFGIHLFVATQRYQDTDVPTPIRSNMGAKLTHAVTPKDAIFNEVPKDAFLQPGQFFLMAQGHFSQYSNVSNIKSSLPYIGNHDEIAMRDAAKKDLEKKNWNMDLDFKISDADDDSATPHQMARTFASMMRQLGRGDVTRRSGDVDIHSIQFIVGEGSRRIGVSSVAKDHVTAEHIQRVKSDAASNHCDAVLLYIMGVKPSEFKGGRQVLMIREANDFGGVKIVPQTIYDLRKDRKNASVAAADTGAGASPSLADVFTERLVYEKIIDADAKAGDESVRVQSVDAPSSAETLERYLRSLNLFESPQNRTIPPMPLLTITRALPFGAVGVFIVVPSRRQFEQAMAIAEGLVAGSGGEHGDLAVLIVGKDLPKVPRASPRVGILRHEVVEDTARRIAAEGDATERARIAASSRYDLLQKVGLCRTDTRYGATRHLVGRDAVLMLSGLVEPGSEAIAGLKILCHHSGEFVLFDTPVAFTNYSLASLGIPPGARLVLDGVMAPLNAHQSDIIGFINDRRPPEPPPSSKFTIQGATLTVRDVAVEDDDDLTLLERMRGGE